MTTDPQPNADVPVADVEVSEAQIAAHWREEDYYRPPAAFIGQANSVQDGVERRIINWVRARFRPRTVVEGR